jgi:hypothetical protein
VVLTRRLRLVCDATHTPAKRPRRPSTFTYKSSSDFEAAAGELVRPETGHRAKVALDYTATFPETSLKRGSTNFRRNNSVASAAVTGAP